MFRRPVSARRGGLVRLGLLLALAALSLGGAAGAATLEGAVELTPPVRQVLQGIGERWLRWVTVLQGAEPQSSAAVVDEILAAAGQIGMERLPDLAIGATIRGVDAARAKDFARAHLALAAAEKLDPGRPEVALAGATVARLEKRYGAMLTGFSEAVVRLFSLPWERLLWLQNLAAWGLALLLLTGGLFVAVQMATKGGFVVHDLTTLMGRLPRPLAFAVALVLLLWPLLLPAGLAWLVIYWSFLLWAHASWSERTVLVFLWLLVGITPLLAGVGERYVDAVLSRPAKALAALEERRLYGDLFSDLGLLKARLPESPAVHHLLADFHRSVGQSEQARALYRQVVAAEPRNTAALLGLGGYAFKEGDLPAALQYFGQAADADPNNAAPLFNQSQVYLALYKFDEATRIRARAQRLDLQQVNRWDKSAERERIVIPDGGLARIPEIRRALLERRTPAAFDRPALEKTYGALAVGALAALLAVTLQWLRRKRPAYPPPSWRLRLRALDLLRRSFLPGLAAAETGRGGELFLTLLIPAALLLLPYTDRFGVRIPWGYDPGNALAAVLGFGGLLVYFILRFLWELRNEV